MEDPSSGRPPAVFALFGPTGAGKTAVAVELARLLRARGLDPVAVSADAFQVYEGLDVLTGKPTAGQRARLEHHLISFVPVSERFSVARYARVAHTTIDTLVAEGRTPVVVGGTGLYLRAALADLDLRPQAPPESRERYERLLAAEGPRALHALLAERDPAAAATVHPNDRKRLVRYLELAELGALDPPPSAGTQLWSGALRHPTALRGLVMERGALVERTARRVDAMLAGGAALEVETALAAGASETARKAVGFEELQACLEGRGTIGEAAASMKTRTARYARRQLTWMRKLPGLEPLDRTELGATRTAALLVEGL